MYDFLKEDDADFPVLERFKPYLVTTPPEDSFSQYLLVSMSEAAREDARKNLEREGCLEAKRTEAQFASCNPVLSSKHKLFMFDIGNVVVNNISMLGKISGLLGIEKEALIADYRHYVFPLMEGLVSEAQYWQHITHVFGVSVLGNPFAEAFKPVFNEPIVTLIGALRAKGHRVVCASNTIQSHWNVLEEMGALALFDKAYASHEMGLSKPSSQFYTSILASEGVVAEQAFFIDDRMDNIESSRSLGIASFLYADLPSGKKDERLYKIFRAYLSHP
ncbi:HAD family hydrolase [Sphaerochaeta halotolerans]|nr:HAD family hydrolase [Sphaerochaeta halotolerans]